MFVCALHVLVINCTVIYARFADCTGARHKRGALLVGYVRCFGGSVPHSIAANYSLAQFVLRCPLIPLIALCLTVRAAAVQMAPTDGDE